MAYSCPQVPTALLHSSHLLALRALLQYSAESDKIEGVGSIFSLFFCMRGVKLDRAIDRLKKVQQVNFCKVPVGNSEQTPAAAEGGAFSAPQTFSALSTSRLPALFTAVLWGGLAVTTLFQARWHTEPPCAKLFLSITRSSVGKACVVESPGDSQVEEPTARRFFIDFF